jgi:hypothetical protein
MSRGPRKDAVAMALPAGRFSLHVRTVGSQRFSALRVRGCDTGGHFDLLPQPKSEFALAELDRHERVYRRYRQNYAEQTEWHEGRVAAV